MSFQVELELDLQGFVVASLRIRSTAIEELQSLNGMKIKQMPPKKE